MIDTSTPQKTAALGFRESPVAQIVVRYRRIVEANNAIERMFGYRRSEVVNRSVQRLYPTTADFTQIGDRCETRMRKTGDTYYEDERFMQSRDNEIFWTRAKGITLTPEDPFALMIWSFEKIASKAYRSVDLSPREREVAHHLVNGHTSREIGDALGISHRTVEVHRARLMRKFNVNNTAALVSEIVLAV
ncbi:LuxR C-terminal-related transcriptional regulator [Pontibaca salina]|uniref:PAS and helix-turn-helix domain-containing protein n=1 Tax=Pontibaca salina TaxID=2795731 RepID=A0A934HQ97_9RHOB|nr:PAS and helix-turn-helix domain-containing protein [Pontibaca salina]MBI6629512.1 PAS and helix-turn-helix domain-containing protein [Pontibaca salina]